ncbi:hypothetical protein QVD17_10935 [Tagetes erecta]|uniref:Uncharacterized protein n=1 Tax=Tagetes erecta TaxID=13708 RepID=A0AAD8L3D4_TARER|nr:hypothetical protein QVD17_10935 [Tagetes erecta]
MSLQQLSHDIAAKIDAKRNRLAILQSQIDEVENQLNSIKNQTQDYLVKTLKSSLIKLTLLKKKLVNLLSVEDDHIPFNKERAKLSEDVGTTFNKAMVIRLEEVP